MTDEIDWSRIARYVGGDCSDEERRALEAKLAVEPTWREAVEAARHVWASTGAEADQWNVQAAWQSVARRQADAPLPAVRSSTVQSREAPLAALPWQGGRWWRASALWAAMLAAVTVGSVAWFRSHAGTRAAPAEMASMYTVTTRPGQRLELRMTDGTRVILGVASTLRYPKTYGTSRRELYLDGEAYFDVTHDESKPMVVYAGNAVARDLGTRFDIRAYPEDGGVEVMVAEGKVELSNAGPPASAHRLVLTPGQLGSVDLRGGITAGHSTDLANRLAWIDGRLVFRNEALRDMLPQLARWYDVEFRLADPALGERRISGTFEHESVPALLQFLTLSLNAKYERDGRTIVLSPN